MIFRFYDQLTPELHEQFSHIYEECCRIAPLTLFSGINFEEDDCPDAFMAAYPEDTQAPISYAVLYRFENTLEVYAFVSPAYRKQGVFRNMIQQIRAHFPKDNLKFLTDEQDAGTVQMLSKKHFKLKEREYLLSYSLKDSATGNATVHPTAPDKDFHLSIIPVQDKNALIPLQQKIFSYSHRSASVYIDSMLSVPEIQAYVIQCSSEATSHNTVSSTDSTFSHIKKIGNPVGMFFLLEEKSDSALEHYLCGFGILPKFRHKGYAFHALELIADMLKNTSNADNILLQVSMTNEAAFKLYQKFGFTCRQFLSIYSLGKDFH